MTDKKMAATTSGNDLNKHKKTSKLKAPKQELREYLVQESDGSTRSIWLRGRDEWALRNLINAGPKGCTPITHPGPRWSAYKFNLVHEFGLHIERVDEPHAGDYPGTHARYILRSKVVAVTSESEAA